VTNRDIDFIEDRTTKLREVMTTDLITSDSSKTLKENNKILLKSKKSKLPIVDQDGKLVALMSRTDLLKYRDFSNATVDEKNGFESPLPLAQDLVTKNVQRHLLKQA